MNITILVVNQWRAVERCRVVSTPTFPFYTLLVARPLTPPDATDFNKKGIYLKVRKFLWISFPPRQAKLPLGQILWIFFLTLRKQLQEYC